MSIRLNGSSSGYTEIDAPAVAGSNTLTLPTGNGTSGQFLQTNGSGALSWGSQRILQVVMGTKTDYSTTTSTTYVDSGLSASITPSSSSNKVLVLISQYVMIAGSSQGQYLYMNLVRGSTQIYEANNHAIVSYDQGGSGVEVGTHMALNYLDSPSSTSSTTYKTQVKRQNGSEARLYNAQMILMEVAA